MWVCVCDQRPEASGGRKIIYFVDPEASYGKKQQHIHSRFIMLLRTTHHKLNIEQFRAKQLACLPACPQQTHRSIRQSDKQNVCVSILPSIVCLNQNWTCNAYSTHDRKSFTISGNDFDLNVCFLCCGASWEDTFRHVSLIKHTLYISKHTRSSRHYGQITK